MTARFHGASVGAISVALTFGVSPVTVTALKAKSSACRARLVCRGEAALSVCGPPEVRQAVREGSMRRGRASGAEFCGSVS